jgi:hypothetical protein
MAQAACGPCAGYHGGMHSCRVLAVLALGVSMLGCDVTVDAQKAAPPPPNPLATATNLKCSFSSFAVNGWTDTTPNTVTSTEDFSFQIVVTNLKKGRARIVGSSASAEAALVLTPTGMNVIEQTPIGNLMLTTIFTTGGQDGKFLATHSRHVGDTKTVPSPSQHYGLCEIVKP